MKAKERLDRILAACGEKMQEEVSALLGKNLTLSNLQTRVVTKAEYFEEPAGKSVLAHVQLEGEFTGQGCLLMSVQDAIRIGGILIMLPDSELQTVIADVDYTKELQDSYGEVANIFCGSLTSTFEEQYPKNFRLVRTEQEVIVPTEVNVESGQPIPVGSYYVASFSMQMEDEAMGDMQLLLPAEPFGLVERAVADDGGDASVSQPEVVDATGGAGKDTVEAVERPERADSEGSKSVSGVGHTTGNGSTEAGGVAPNSSKKLEKQKKRIDDIQKICLEKIGEEVGALLGATLTIKASETGIFSKEELLEQAEGKQVLNRMDVRGGEEGQEAFLLAPITGAIHLGGTLIMLPESELEETVRNEEFGEDAQDAYGEIANIIAGVYTFVFEEQHRKKLGFVKTTMETVVPVKIDPDSDEVIPKQIYYLCSGDMELDGKELGRLQGVFPATLFGLEGLAIPEEVVDATAPVQEAGETGAVGVGNGQVGGTAGATGGTASSGATSGATAGGGMTGAAPDMLIFSDDEASGGRIADILRAMGYTPSLLPFKSSVNENITTGIRLIFLVMKEVSEQGFGTAIKISSSGFKIPLVAAGPAWTRTLVIKAVKYGADDILITPPTEADVREKVEMNLVNLAA